MGWTEAGFNIRWSRLRRYRREPWTVGEGGRFRGMQRFHDTNLEAFASAMMMRTTSAPGLLAERMMVDATVA